ncbi:YciI family protein [Caulobacter sp. KR2-114]|uniref:YciI family protein n=1 Tax=Caulobacter sp. KR2-114 TaxID=3400912 RepID=UPI003C007B76
MQYLLMLYVEEAGWGRLTPGEQEAAMGAYGAYNQALADSGAMLASGRLQPVASAHTVRVKDGRRQVLDGPFAETKEVVGGYYLIEAADEAAALDWAARCPAAGHGAVEVRPVWG